MPCLAPSLSLSLFLSDLLSIYLCLSVLPSRKIRLAIF